MTMKIGDTVIIAAEDDRECELCGVMDECRPAGPNGEQVCYDCALKNPAAMHRYTERLLGGRPVQ
jgi:hypothetical protein